MLFREGVKIDLKDGSVQPKGVEVLVQILNPDEPYSVGGDVERSGVYRAIYNIENWKARIVNIIENAVGAYLRRLTIDEATTQAKAGYDLVNQENLRIEGIAGQSASGFQE